MEFDSRVRRRYEAVDEDDRLWKPGIGELVRLRTWDILDRLLAEPARVADVGGGPGTHAAHLAERGHDVTLIDPMTRHVEQATARAAARPEASFRAEQGEARSLPLADASVDAVLLMGPLYHLTERADRLAALAEALRVLRPGGLIAAEIITRHAWVLDATNLGLLDDPRTWDDLEWIRRTGLSKDPAKLADEGFWAYFHEPAELTTELEVAGFEDITLRVVEGFAGLLGDLPERMREPDDLLRAVRMVESEPSMLGASQHVIGAAYRS